MVVIACIDDNSGMMFNNRRQSKDRLLRSRILVYTASSKLLMNGYSAKQFEETAPQIVVSEDFLEIACDNDYCFVENSDFYAYLPKISKLIIYKWNRSYPLDVPFPLNLADWKLVKTEDFVGYSHEKITEEIYVK